MSTMPAGDPHRPATTLRVLGLALGGAAVLGLAWRLALAWEDLLLDHGFGCLLRRLTGCYCAGCGGTRAFFALLRGDFARSWSLNPLVILLALATAAVVARAALLRAWPARFARLAKLRAKAWHGWLALGLMLLFGVLRNLPWWPFCLLAPH